MPLPTVLAAPVGLGAGRLPAVDGRGKWSLEAPVDGLQVCDR